MSAISSTRIVAGPANEVINPAIDSTIAAIAMHETIDFIESLTSSPFKNRSVFTTLFLKLEDISFFCMCIYFIICLYFKITFCFVMSNSIH